MSDNYDKINPNPVTKRIAVKAECVFLTPALIGSGVSENTDSDIMRDSSGKPFLPGSTVAGVLRSLLCFAQSESNALFGKEGDTNNISPLWVFDSELANANIIELDGVALDSENKVAIDRMKYDFEAIDTGAIFTMRLLLTIRRDDMGKNYESMLNKLISILNTNLLCVGAKTNRGFGQIKCNSIFQRQFILTPDNKDDLNNWINFEWKNSKDWEAAVYEDFSSNYSVLTATLKLDGSIMIRDTRNIYENLTKDEKAPDYKHITNGGEPVIFGTSWAGAFRAGLYKLLKSKFPQVEIYLDSVFGVVKKIDDKELTIASQVVFNVSFLKPVNEVVDGFRNITRVKIDRFTSGAANGALFNEKPWYGGETILEIRFPRERTDIGELLLLGLDAINNDLIQIGGETSIGRGFFKIKGEHAAIDGEPISLNSPKKSLIHAIHSIKDIKEIKKVGVS